MLCSDGVSSELDDHTLAKIIELGLGAQDTAEKIVDCAVAAGGHDNATAIVIRVQGSVPRVETLSHAIRLRIRGQGCHDRRDVPPR